MRIILGCTREMAVAAMLYLLEMLTIRFRWQMCQASTYLNIRADKEYLLHEELLKVTGTRLRRIKSCLGQTEDVIQCVILRLEGHTTG